MADLGQLLDRTLVLVAHPDDEAVGCGTLLQRMREPSVLFLTDGSPEDPYFWARFGSRKHYAGVRANEARMALAAAGVEHVEFAGIQDQTVYRRLDDAFDYVLRAIGRIRPRALLALAYEGGHPDHDSSSFLAWNLGQRLSLPVWEMPLYFRGDGGEFIAQTQFLSAVDGHYTVTPTPQELARKRTMLAAYVSQGDFLHKFTEAVEHFRPQASYDYSRPPHEGVLNYEAWGWPIKGTEVCAAFTEFLGRNRKEIV